MPGSKSAMIFPLLRVAINIGAGCKEAITAISLSIIMLLTTTGTAKAFETDMNIDTTDYIEVQSGVDPVCSVIWLHGLGADGHDFEPIVPQLGISQQTPMRFIFPHAPVRPITINNGMEMRGWYDVTGMAFDRGQDRAGIEHSAAILRSLLEQENRRGIKFENIFLAGFSQGGAIVLHTGLRFNQRLAGIIALSTYLPLAESFDLEKSTVNQQTPIFMAHGVDDPLIPIELAQSSKKKLMQSGFSVLWHQYPMQHSVSPREIDDIAAFLRARIKPCSSGE